MRIEQVPVNVLSKSWIFKTEVGIIIKTNGTYIRTIILSTFGEMVPKGYVYSPQKGNKNAPL